MNHTVGLTLTKITKPLCILYMCLCRFVYEHSIQPVDTLEMRGPERSEGEDSAAG